MKKLVVMAAVIVLLIIGAAHFVSADCPLRGTPACPEYPDCCK